MTQQHQIDDIKNQGAEEFLKGSEGAQILMKSQANVTGEEEGNQNETNSTYELTRGKKKSTARKTETMEEEKGT